MNKQEKVEFVNDLMGSIRHGIINAIEKGKIPEDWNGHQLRMLVAEKAKDAANFGSISKDRHVRLAYENDVLVNNL